MAVPADLLLSALAECDCGCEDHGGQPLTAETGLEGVPLTSEPPLAAEPALTSEPPAAAEPALTSEPLAAAPGALDPEM